VPFILKLAGQREAARYEPAFNTVVVHDLILAILGGEVLSPADAVAWLDQSLDRREPLRDGGDERRWWLSATGADPHAR
jgi:hypothetical protein